MGERRLVASGEFFVEVIENQFAVSHKLWGFGVIHGEVIWRNFCLCAQAKPERSYLRFWFVEMGDSGVGDVLG